MPLGIAFLLGRRAARRRYSYGYGRAEDVAGLFVVIVVAASALVACGQAITRLVRPQPVHHLGYVVAAAVIGALGNESVARYRIRIGRWIGSAALVADGLHARTDALTSLAVLLGAAGVALGWRWADPIVGLGIAVLITVGLVRAARTVFVPPAVGVLTRRPRENCRSIERDWFSARLGIRCSRSDPPTLNGAESCLSWVSSCCC
ncbi:MAG: hypothetical protein QOE51_2129 [Actinoplanes sp.]|nr:hypothetical protein [Actinoplanes sp.]